MATHAGLFSNDLISPAVTASLPQSYTIRALEKGDYLKGVLDVLRTLTNVGEISQEKWEERYDFMATQGKGTYFVIVVEDDQGRIVATGQLIVERKL